MDLEGRAIEELAKAQLEVLGLAVSVVFPAALNAVVKMQVAEVLATAAEEGHRSLSADEIVARMPNRPSQPNSKNLERLLRVLSFKGVFKEEARHDKRRTFRLTPMSSALIRNLPEGTMANYVLLTSLGQEFIESCKHLTAAVLESKVPFAMAHGGKHQFQYCAANPDYSNVFQAAMTDHSHQLVDLMLAKFEGFKDVQRMADVGGGVGTTIGRIVEQYPHIQGINFDLPHVIAHAPQREGVEHIAGDMFESVPPDCDAFFLKNIIHDWDDELNIQILMNCHKALPSRGRVIMVDAVLPATTLLRESSLDDMCAFEADITMMAVSAHGRERDAEEWENLADRKSVV